MTNFKIDIISDQICPWCFVGKRMLEGGIKAYKAAHPDSKDTWQIEWWPFYLNPTAPKAGMDKRTRWYEKYGAARANATFQTLAVIGKEVGIDFDWGGRTGNTRDSHRLIHLAKQKGLDVQNKVVDYLFDGYLTKQRDLTSHAFLAEAGEHAGLDRAEIDKVLSTDLYGPEVDAEVQRAQSKFVSGVPHITVQKKFVVPGTTSPTSWVALFDKIKAAESG